MPKHEEQDENVHKYKWTQVSQDNIDKLNDLVPAAALPFDIDSLQSTHAKFNGKFAPWIDFMNDCNISARKKVIDVINNDWQSGMHWRQQGSWDGHWRLLYSLAVYSEPGKPHSWRQVRADYPESEVPFEEYIKHLCRRFEREVALAWGQWKWSPGLLRKNRLLWNVQYATSAQNADALNRLLRCNDGDIQGSVDLLDVGNTTILSSKKNEAGHW